MSGPIDRGRAAAALKTGNIKLAASVLGKSRDAEARGLAAKAFARGLPTFATAPVAAYDATRASTVFQEIAGGGSTPSTHLGVVGTLRDISGNGRHLVAPNNGARPEFNKGGWISADARATFLSAAFSISQPIVRVASWRPIGGATVNSQIFGGVSANAGALFLDSASTVAVYSGNVGGFNQPITLQTNLTTVERHNGASSRLSVDGGVTYVTGNAGSALPGGVQFGKGSTANSYAGARLYRMVEFNADISDADIALAVAWCRAAYPTERLITDGRSNVPALRQAHANRKFGVMFCFSIPTFNNEQIGTGTESANTFNPSLLNFNQWLDAAQAAGANYVVPVFKHHDGFCLWPSATTTYNISASSWYATNGSPDLLSQFYQNATSRGLAVIPYVSVWDRKYEINNPPVNSRNSGVNFREYTKAILAEVQARCPNAPGVWLDGWAWNASSDYNTVWPPEIFPKFYDSLWPNGLMIENDHLGTTVDTDIVVYEEGVQTLPGGNTTPAEVTATIFATQKWFWQSGYTLSKTAAQVASNVHTANANNATYTLSVGPDNTGLLPSDVVSVLQGVGPLL